MPASLGVRCLAPQNPHPQTMKTLFTTFVMGAAVALVAHAQTATTTPVGYVTIACPANSDTIVGVPLKQPTVAAGALSANPSVASGSATLTISGAAFTASQFANSHYVKFTSGASSGKYYAVTANTTNTLTVDLNGDTLGAVQNDTLSVTKFWTLGELFNPAQSTTDPTTTGNAIVASTSASPAGRRTQILIPDSSSSGINLAPSAPFFILNGAWRRHGVDVTISFNDFQLWPDSYFMIRHSTGIASGTSYVSSGEVELQSTSIPLSTLVSGKQDNYIALVRPVDVKLKDLNLGGTSAFVSSTSGTPAGRRDEVYTYSNIQTAVNKSPSATYFYLNGAWRKVGQDVSLDFGDDVISAGSGFTIRKYQTAAGATVFWNNTASY